MLDPGMANPGPSGQASPVPQGFCYAMPIAAPAAGQPWGQMMAMPLNACGSAGRFAFGERVFAAVTPRVARRLLSRGLEPEGTPRISAADATPELRRSVGKHPLGHRGWKEGRARGIRV